MTIASGLPSDPAHLEHIARTLRVRIIENSHRTGTPHLGSCLSSVDILTALYFGILDIDPQAPDAERRDRFILSKGHGVPALFQVLALRGFFPENWLDSYGQDGSPFSEHPPIPGRIPGIEAATGSLGHGLPIGVGMALADRITHNSRRVVVLLGDGECNEGTIWEAAMLAASQRLGNLVAIVDYNKWQGTGRTDDIMALAPLADKWRAFGWDAVEIDGHDMGRLLDELTPTRQENGRPLAVVAHTVKGKGVSFMEDDNNWHYRIPTADEVHEARRQLGIGA
ncbi:MAG: transketolase [Telmatospirillum sp.]|nr:transketolase [Telmatospirillum sp.]